MKRLILYSLIFTISFAWAFWASPAPAQQAWDSAITAPFNPSDWDWFDCPLGSLNNPSPDNPDTGDMPFGLPLALKTRFPFDLIYPLNPQDLKVDEECLSTSLWGIEREMCAPMMIAKTAKNVFLLKLVVQSLLSF